MSVVCFSLPGLLWILQPMALSSHRASLWLCSFNRLSSSHHATNINATWYPLGLFFLFFQPLSHFLTLFLCLQLQCSLKKSLQCPHYQWCHFLHKHLGFFHQWWWLFLIGSRWEILVSLCVFGHELEDTQCHSNKWQYSCCYYQMCWQLTCHKGKNKKTVKEQEDEYTESCYKLKEQKHQLKRTITERHKTSKAL